MATELQQWLHGNSVKRSQTVIDTQKKIGPVLAGGVANDAMSIKGIADNTARVVGSVGTAIYNKKTGADIPVSGDYYDSIRWLVDGASDTLPPYLTGKDNQIPSMSAPTVSEDFNTSYLDTLTQKTVGEDADTTKYNNFTSKAFANDILLMITSPFSDATIDDGARYLKGKQLMSFNRYLAFNRVAGVTPDDPKYFKDKNAKLSDGWTPIGTRSLFNAWKIVAVNEVRDTAFIDSPANRKTLNERYKCDVDTLVQETRKGNMGRETFSHADFMFCTHAGEVSNEHLITLRKFNTPCQDNILINLDKDYNFKARFPQPCIGVMVTWLGTSGNTIDNVLSFQMSQNTQNVDIDKEKETGNENGGVIGKLTAMMDKKRAGMALQGGPSAFGKTTGKLDGAIPGINSDVGGRKTVSEFHASKNANAIWRNNRVVKPKMMEGFGVKYTHSITLTFEYDLMSFGGINGRQAFLDLMANILITTSNECSFYGNAYRTTGVEPNEIYNQLYKGIDGSKSFGENLSTLGNNIYSQLKAMCNSGNLIEAGKTILNNLGNSILGTLMNKLGRNAFVGMNSSFSDSPLGNWHVTIGNPRHPIATIGNLWLTDAKINFNGPLNIDGFPSKIKVTVTLDECTDRDPIRVERLFADGVGRIYHHVPKSALTDMYTRQGKEVKTVSVSNKKKNNSTNQTEHEHSIDAKDAANQKANSTSPKANQEIDTGITDLGMTGGDKAAQPSQF